LDTFSLILQISYPRSTDFTQETEEHADMHKIILSSVGQVVLVQRIWPLLTPCSQGAGEPALTRTWLQFPHLEVWNDTTGKW